MGINYFTIPLIAGIYVFRLLCGLLVNTFLFPDEWWQFSEPAYKVVYGGGYLTWDWLAGIRSYVPILPMIALLRLTKMIGIGEEWMAKNGARVIMAGWLTLTDVYTVKIAGKVFGPSVRPFALLFTLTSSLHASRSTRSLSNNVEMTLSTVGFYYFDWQYGLGLIMVGLACLTRISAVLFWIVPLLIKFRRISWIDRLIVTPLVIIVTICFGALIDSVFHQKFLLSWWNFFYWNVLRGVSLEFGTDSITYHFRTTLPLMINTSLVHFMYGVWSGVKTRKGGLIMITSIAFLVFNSLQKHKETRFLAPLQPFLLLFSAYGAQQMDLSKNKLVRIGKTILLVGLIGSQIVIGWYFARVHYSGSYEIIGKLRHLIDIQPGSSSVFFLTPCHVTPYQGYLFRHEIPADFVKCHPKVVDEVMPVEDSIARDQFQNDPDDFVKTNVIEKGFSHVIIFEGDLPKYEHLFTESYKICSRSSKPFLPRIGGSKSRGDALILCKQ